MEHGGRSTPALPSRADFGILGHRCRATGLPPRVARWLRVCWECDVESPGGARRIDIAFRSTAPWVDVPPHDGTAVTSFDGVELTWLRHADEWWSTTEDDSGVEFKLLDDRAWIRVWCAAWRAEPSDDAPDAAPPSAPTERMVVALHVALCEILRAGGFIPLRAAVAVRDGRATALVGAGGTGKSTTLVTAVDAGWLPLGENLAWLDPSTRQIYGWRGDRGVRITDDGMRRLPDRARRARWRRGRDGRLFLTYGELAPTRPARASLTRVAVLHRDAGRDTRYEPLEADEATRALWHSAGDPLSPHSRALFAARVPELLERLEWKRLVLGRGAPVL